MLVVVVLEGVVGWLLFGVGWLELFVSCFLSIASSSSWVERELAGPPPPPIILTTNR